jgi:L-iditol 2-dehydrogenase
VVAVASTTVVRQAFDAVRPGGKMLLFAQTRLNDPLEVDAGKVCMLEKDLIGSYSADITLQDLAAELIFSRQINVRDLITHRYPLGQIEEAFETASRPSEGTLKVMVHP